LAQHLDIRDQRRLHPSPVGKSLAAGTSDLISKQLGHTVVNPVVMWFNNAHPVLVAKPKQSPLLDGHRE